MTAPPPPPSVARLAVALPLAFSLVALPLWGELPWWLRRDDRLFRYLLGSFALSGAALLVLGALLLRGRRVPAAALLTVALAPAFAGAGAAWYQHARTLGDVDGFRDEFIRSHGPNERLRLLASFEESFTKNLSCGALVSGLLALALAVLVTFTCAGGAPAPPPGRRGARAARAAAVSAACLGASAAAHLWQGAMRREAWLALGALAVGAVLSTVLAAMGQRTASAPRGLVPVALAASALLLGYAGYEDAIHGQLVALEMLERPLPPEDLASVTAAAPTLRVALIDGALALLMSAVPWIAGRAPRDAPAPRRYGSVLACAALAGLLAAGLVSAQQRMERDVATFGAPIARFFRVAGVELPLSRGQERPLGAETQSANQTHPPALFVTRAGELLIDDSEGERPPVPFTPGVALGSDPPILAADRAVSFGQLAKALEPIAGGKHLRVSLVVAVRPPARREGPARFPEVYTDEILFRELWFVPRLELDKPQPASHELPMLGILRDPGGARWVPLPGGTRSWPVPVGRTPEDRSARGSIYATYTQGRPGFQAAFFAPAPEVLLDEILGDAEEIGLLKQPPEDRDPPRRGPLVITPDRAAIEAAAARAPAKPSVFVRNLSFDRGLDLQGPADRDQVDAQLRRTVRMVGGCLTREIVGEPPSSLRPVKIVLSIDRSGKPSAVTASGTGDQVVDRCVLEVLKGRFELGPQRAPSTARAAVWFELGVRAVAW